MNSEVTIHGMVLISCALKRVDIFPAQNDSSSELSTFFLSARGEE